LHWDLLPVETLGYSHQGVACFATRNQRRAQALKLLSNSICWLACRLDLGAQYGGSRHPIATGINKLLQLNDPEVVGVFAQLGFVDEPRLSAVLAANYASTMQVVMG
jgi:hypothetical protein